MPQYQTIAQVLFILSVFNLVFATPVAREIHDARDNMVARILVENVTAVSKEQRHWQSARGSAESTPSQPPPDGLTPSQPPSDGSTPPHSSPPPGGPTPMHGSLSPPGGPATFSIDAPPGGPASSGTVLASGQPPAVQSTASQHTAVTHDMVATNPTNPRPKIGRKQAVFFVVAVGGIALYATLYHHFHHNDHDD